MLVFSSTCSPSALIRAANRPAVVTSSAASAGSERFRVTAPPNQPTRQAGVAGWRPGLVHRAGDATAARPGVAARRTDGRDDLGGNGQSLRGADSRCDRAHLDGSGPLLRIG